MSLILCSSKLILILHRPLFASRSIHSLSFSPCTFVYPQAETLAVYVAASLFLLMASIALWVGVALSLRVVRAKQRVNGTNTD